jgi:hypothetical protein
MTAQTASANESERRGEPGARRRLWGVRLVVLAATAAALGVTQQQLSESQGGMAGLAARQNVSLERVRSVALVAAEPLLDEAVRAGAISEADRRSLRWRIRDRGVV